MNAEELIAHLKALKVRQKSNAELKEARKKATNQEKRRDYYNWFKSLTPNQQAEERRRIREANRKTKLKSISSK